MRRWNIKLRCLSIPYTLKKNKWVRKKWRKRYKQKVTKKLRKKLSFDKEVQKGAEKEADKEVDKEVEKEKEQAEGTQEAPKKDQPRKDKGKEKQLETSSSEDEESEEEEDEDEFDRRVSSKQTDEWDTISLARDVQKRMRQIIRTTKEKDKVFDEIAEVIAEQAAQIESQKMINSEWSGNSRPRQLKTNQEKVEYLEKKDVEREKQMLSMQNEVDKH